MSRIIVISPHPDDETLGCGGTLLRHKAEGDELHWLIMTAVEQGAEHSEGDVHPSRAIVQSVAKAFGFSKVHETPYVAAELDTLPKKRLVEVVSKVFHETMPDTVYLPYRTDIHTDHEAVFDAVTACTKSFRHPYVKRVRAYETLSETEFGMRPEDPGFRPNLWIDISQYVERKIEIMRIYKDELGHHPFPRSEVNIRALATLRGAAAGFSAAESFMSLKEIIG